MTTKDHGDISKLKPPKSWWPGDSRAEKYMYKVGIALDRQGITGEARTDIYNRSYEAVYEAIIDLEKKFRASWGPG